VGGINEKNPAFPALRFFQTRKQFVIEKLELKLRVSFPGNRSAFAELHAKADHDPPRLRIGQTDTRDRLDSHRALARRGDRCFGERLLDLFEKRLNATRWPIMPILK